MTHHPLDDDHSGTALLQCSMIAATRGAQTRPGSGTTIGMTTAPPVTVGDRDIEWVRPAVALRSRADISGVLCEIPGLRHRRVAGFPCGWFYFIADDGVDVVRLLADAQNHPAILADAEQE